MIGVLVPVALEAFVIEIGVHFPRASLTRLVSESSRITDLKAAGLPFRNEMEIGPRAANRFKLKTPTAIRSSCSSLLAIEESQAT